MNSSSVDLREGGDDIVEFMDLGVFSSFSSVLFGDVGQGPGGLGQGLRAIAA